MPQRRPAIGEDVSHLFGAPSQPAVGDDVSSLMDGGLYSPTRKPASAEDFTNTPRMSYPRQVAERFTSGLARAAKNPTVYAGLAGAVAAPFTGGLSLPAAMAAEAAAAGGGTLVGHGAKALSGDPSDLSDVAGDVNYNAARGAAGPLAGKAIGLAGRGVGAVARAVPSSVKAAVPYGVDIVTGNFGRMARRILGAALEKGATVADELPKVVDDIEQPFYTGMSAAPPQTIAQPGGFSMPAVAPRAAPVAPPAGRVVAPPVRPSVEDEMAGALSEVRTAPAMPRVTTPPQPDLPAGYTPRTTVPKPKAVKAEPTTPPATAEPPKRAYFLKSPEDIAAAKVKPEAVTPSALRPEDLPASWRSHTGQDIFPTTGAEGKEIAAAFRQELADRGMSVGEAMMLVSKNKSLSTQQRAQIQRALSKMPKQ